MNALVIFESMYGNTRAIAQAVADGLGASGSVLVSVVPVSAASDVSEPESFLVTRRNVLGSGETDRAREWGTRLSALATARAMGAASGATLPGRSAR